MTTLEIRLYKMIVSLPLGKAAEQMALAIVYSASWVLKCQASFVIFSIIHYTLESLQMTRRDHTLLPKTKVRIDRLLQTFVQFLFSLTLKNYSSVLSLMTVKYVLPYHLTSYQVNLQLTSSIIFTTFSLKGKKFGSYFAT